ncbi:methionine ABC transporter ATP-binding protein [Anaerosalibacter bizertensis]|uniref:Methionine ABC transporter ATP-binding protein n=1 Tax=Anaerosalibacter bizertensis TaxID=932217 RepID=A0A9Q4AB64_9FIRM|nr:methionine ABC transporter ATP-binding protein [Anaerosalibacter bizertensis]MBV1818131.1 methionine ABC transporter ATP-binding protein [Bacteroidales bacterium MSK.15.36]MCB5560649.1 methionine ABC transporter ATP-binding protein [Anaerosalibacter bizertensis]MCG4564462.1 methionine ABC transporter ATP-binding protein [Anaerosalibacter bizertensis]MCG4581352.1 methionine ABC transporter ATP-binding protein [Anaerosalibacter bizertensis]MCG4585598.1 methionine ABC transporter ATP-binding p
MIKVEGLSKTYKNNNKEIYALKNINIEIKKGEIFGIIGLSGAGKSTLIRCLNRLEEPTNGKIFIDGKEITNLNNTDLRETRKDIGMIFQHFNLLSSKNVYQNIAFPLELEGLKKDEIDKRINTLLEYVDLEDKKFAYPSQLSGGQKQRVAIARSLANNPKILLSDEGTSALDPKTTKSILELLNKIRKEFGLTIVLITHQMEVIKDICDRVAIIEDGEIIELNTVEEIFANPKTKTATEFISTLKINTQEEINYQRKSGSKILRLSFVGENAKKPIVSKMVKQFDIDVNILSGNINELISTSIGNLVLEISGEDNQIEKAIDWLRKENIRLEVI